MLQIETVSPYVLSASDVITIGFALSIFAYFDRRIRKIEKDWSDWRKEYEQRHAELSERLARLEQKVDDLRDHKDRDSRG
jgi:hypothetical protein